VGHPGTSSICQRRDVGGVDIAQRIFEKGLKSSEVIDVARGRHRCEVPGSPRVKLLGDHRVTAKKCCERNDATTGEWVDHYKFVPSYGSSGSFGERGRDCCCSPCPPAEQTDDR
jgi:hypothetical protein